MIFSETTSKRSKGFTLIELLVVISIISLLSTIILASVSTARARARDMVRLSDLHQLQNALEMYRVDNGTYPLSGADIFHHPLRAGSADCFVYPWDATGYGYSGAGGYIPSLAPKYISKLPEDPSVSKLPATVRCYAYESDGTDYMVMATNAEVYSPPDNFKRTNDHSGNNPIAIFTPGAEKW